MNFVEIPFNNEKKRNNRFGWFVKMSHILSQKIGNKIKENAAEKTTEKCSRF